MVRDYNVWESFNRDNEHGFYIMSQARAIVSHRLVVRTIDSWLVHLTLRKSDWWRVFRSLGQLSWDMKLEPTSTFIMRNPPKIAWAVMKVCEISKSGIPSYVWNAAICHYDSVGYDYNKAIATNPHGGGGFRRTKGFLLVADRGDPTGGLRRLFTRNYRAFG